MDESSLFTNMGPVATQQILLPIISMKCPWLYQNWENWPPNSCDLNLPDYAILGMMLYKNIMQYEDIEGLSATISDAWDRPTKNSAIVQ